MFCLIAIYNVITSEKIYCNSNNIQVSNFNGILYILFFVSFETDRRWRFEFPPSWINIIVTLVKLSNKVCTTFC